MENRVCKLVYSRKLDNMFVSNYISLLELLPTGTKVVCTGEDPTTNNSFMILENSNFKDLPLGYCITEIYADLLDKSDGTCEWDVDFENAMEVTLQATTSSSDSRYIDQWQYFRDYPGEYTYTILSNFTMPQFKIPKPSDALLNMVGIKKTACNHSWKSYTGLSQTYTYCEHCDIKESDV